MSAAPWWWTEFLASVPLWLPYLLAVLGGVTVTQVWKRRRERDTRKPYRDESALMAIVITTALAYVAGYRGGDPLAPMGPALLVGVCSPILWRVLRWALRRYVPDAAAIIGEDRRRHDRNGDPAWTPRERAARRSIEDPEDTLFGTGKLRAEDVREALKDDRRDRS